MFQKKKMMSTRNSGFWKAGFSTMMASLLLLIRTSEALSPTAILAEFGVSPERGFLLPSDPIVSLPLWTSSEHEVVEAWDAAAALIPGTCAAGRGATVLRGLVECDPETILTWPTAALERALLDLSFLAHAAIHYGNVTSLPRSLAVPWCAIADKLGRPPVLTYYTYNLCNFQRLDPSEPVELGNIARIRNFLGGQDEEWFSMIHVAIEAIAGRAIAACCAAHLEPRPETHLTTLTTTLREMRSILDRMDDGCDAYIYHNRVRTPMQGFRDLVYEGVPGTTSPWRTETYFGETGAQSSVIPAIDAALGLRCDSLASSGHAAESLVPYLQKMREYMPPHHAALITYFETEGPELRARCAASPTAAMAFNDAVNELAQFRKLHLSLAYRFVRQWDDRSDADVLGTGGTAFMPYLRSHRDATLAHAIHDS